VRLFAAVRWSIPEHGGEPSTRHVDQLLDERLARRGGSTTVRKTEPHSAMAQKRAVPPKNGSRWYLHFIVIAGVTVHKECRF
jgi:hypothetical protein